MKSFSTNNGPLLEREHSRSSLTVCQNAADSLKPSFGRFEFRYITDNRTERLLVELNPDPALHQRDQKSDQLPSIDVSISSGLACLVLCLGPR